MPPHEASTLLVLSSSLLSQSQKISNLSSQTLTALPSPVNFSSKLVVLNPSPSKNQSETQDTLYNITNCALLLLVLPTDSSSMTPHINLGMARPTTYAPHLTPFPSPLYPHCLARNCLCLWKPAPHQAGLQSSSHSSGLSKQDISQIFEETSNAWAESTWEAYSSGILAYHVYCNKRASQSTFKPPFHTPWQLPLLPV
jgi:hypothetical protein